MGRLLDPLPCSCDGDCPSRGAPYHDEGEVPEGATASPAAQVTPGKTAGRPPLEVAATPSILLPPASISEAPSWCPATRHAGGSDVIGRMGLHPNPLGRWVGRLCRGFCCTRQRVAILQGSAGARRRRYLHVQRGDVLHRSKTLSQLSVLLSHSSQLSQHSSILGLHRLELLNKLPQLILQRRGAVSHLSTTTTTATATTITTAAAATTGPMPWATPAGGLGHRGRGHQERGELSLSMLDIPHRGGCYLLGEVLC